MGRRPGVTSDETRHQLLDATIEVLLTRGYEGTRVSEIAKVAGVTAGAIYNHFSSKAELLSAAIEAQGPDVIADLLRSGTGLEVVDTFRQIGASLPERASAMGPLLLELVVTATRDPEVARVVGGGFAEREQLTADVIRLAQGAGEVAPDLDAGALARFTTMLALGSLVVSALGLEPVDEQGWADIVDRTLETVRAPQGRP